MRTSATGRCDRPTVFCGRPRSTARNCGFTLIEILVALVIVGVLAGGIALAMPDPAAAERSAALRDWHRQADLAARRALAGARPWAWEIGQAPGNLTAARLLVDENGQWRPAAGADGHWRPLPAGLRLSTLDIEGQTGMTGGRIVFAAIPPLFAVDLDDGGKRWRIAGRPSGAIAMERLP